MAFYHVLSLLDHFLRQNFQSSSLFMSAFPAPCNYLSVQTPRTPGTGQFSGGFHHELRLLQLRRTDLAIALLPQSTASAPAMDSMDSKL